ncbi:MAG: DUF2065 domain-containing protein [Proteobacteria bacterium]|nr:DUF2065 domain-containing protein [Pseudomonadota bacterium]
MDYFLTALGLVLVIEGLLYALVPGHLRHMLETLRALSDEQLRILGTVALALGVLAVWLAQTFLRT